MNNMDVSALDLAKLFILDAATGNLVWRERFDMEPKKLKRWNVQHAGKVAGSKQDDGYIRIGIYRKKYAAHRIVWAIVHGSWPICVIDHVNGNTSDNRPKNLREASISENMWNQRLSKSSVSGLKGVGFNRRINRWKARIAANGKRVTIGHFKTREEAYAAYCAAAKQLHGEFFRAA